MTKTTMELRAAAEGAGRVDQTTTPPSWSMVHLLVAAGVAGAVVAVLWLPPLRSSLWLDETGTVWLTRGSLFDSLGHAFEFQGGSPLYYVVEWTARATLGKTELTLRIPSLLGMGLAAWLLFRLGRRVFDAGTGALAAVLFVSLPAIAFAAGDARPYALAMAALIGSGLALTRWLDSARPRDAVVYALTFAATVYLHYLFALPLIAHGLYVIFRLEHGTPVTKKQVLATYGLAALLLAPSVPTLLRVLSQRGLLSNPYPQSAGSVLASLFPGRLVWIVVAGLLVGLGVWRGRLTGWDSRNGAIPFTVGWFAITFLALVILSEATETDVMVPRYFLSVVPAVTLLTAAVLRRIANAWAPLVTVAVVAVASMVLYASTTHTNEHWRPAAELERKLVAGVSSGIADEPVLLYSGFIEAQRIDWVRDPEKASYLNAPTAMYPFDGDVVALPFGLGRGGEQYMEDLVAAPLFESDRFVLVTRGTDSFRDWLDVRLSPEGFKSHLVASFSGNILVYVFAR